MMAGLVWNGLFDFFEDGPGWCGHIFTSIQNVFRFSDDGGCTKTRKSTSSGVMMHGKPLIKAYSSTQHVLALSASDSEFHGWGELKRGWGSWSGTGRGFPVDASAAKAMLSRAKHIHRSYLWLQQRINPKYLSLQKVGTKCNPADLGAKSLDGTRVSDVVALTHLRFEVVEHRMTLLVDMWIYSKEQIQGSLHEFQVTFIRSHWSSQKGYRPRASLLLTLCYGRTQPWLVHWLLVGGLIRVMMLFV